MSLKSVASASSIDLSGITCAEVTGTTTISTITGMRDGEIKVLYAAGAWAFDTAGNIAAALTAASGSTYVIFQRNSTIYAPQRPLIAADIPNLDASKITTGLLALARGGTNADLSATGGASKVLKQTSAGAAITVAQLAASDLSNGTTGSSGGVVLAGSPTITTPTISGVIPTYNGITTAGLGFPVIVAKSELTGQSAGTGTITLVSANAPAGLYRINATWYTTTNGNAVTGSFEYTHTDDVTTKTISPSPTISLNATTTASFTEFFYATTGAITYDITLSGAAGLGRYSVRVTLERLT